MLEFVLHAGHDHPTGGWILVASLLSFVAGLGLGLSSDRVRETLRQNGAEPADDASN